MSTVSLALDDAKLAQHYEEVSIDRQFESGKVLLRKLRLNAGERVLDVGSGTGLLAEYAADIVGTSGSVEGLDPLPLRIDIARRRSRPNLRFRVGNALDLGNIEDATYDVVYLNAVFHWLPEKLGPLHSFLRILKPGGRLGISTSAIDHVGTLETIRRQVLSAKPYDAYPDVARPASHHVTLDELRALFGKVGFDSLSIDLIPNEAVYTNPAAVIDFVQASSFGNFLGHIPAALRDRARADIETELENRRTPQGILVRGTRVIAIAVKPVRVDESPSCLPTSNACARCYGGNGFAP
jgi:ubiquinone/menaquinone biosynthesis C-methylase UbiE